MEATMEVEDDVFFADLSKRISLLIMDDEEDHLLPSNYPSATLQAFNQVIRPATQMPVLHQQASTRESKGTGVFIPRSSDMRRKNRQGRNTKFHRHSNNSRVLPHDAAYPNINNPQVDSFYARRF